MGASKKQPLKIGEITNSQRKLYKDLKIEPPDNYTTQLHQNLHTTITTHIAKHTHT
jgi:hypothetical protein